MAPTVVLAGALYTCKKYSVPRVAVADMALRNGKWGVVVGYLISRVSFLQ